MNPKTGKASAFWKRIARPFWELAGRVSVRTKIMGIVLGGTFLLSLTLTLQVRYTLVEILEEELGARGVSIGRDLAARSTDLILVNDLYGLRQLLIETKANNPDLRYAFIADPQGQILAHSFGSGFPVDLAALNTVDPQAYQNTVILQTDEGVVWDIAVPIFDGQAGVARVGLSSQGIQRVLLDLTSQVLLTTSFVLGLSLLAAAFLTFILTRPILELVEATRAVSRADLSHRVRRWADDEIGELAVAFNQMTAELERMEEIRQEREVLRRQLLYNVITVQEDERRRIARELHDSTSQGLTSLMVGLRNLESACDNPQVHIQTQDLRRLTGSLLDDVHNLALQLRPIALDDLGLAAALDRLASDWQKRHHIAVDVAVHLGTQRLPENVETALYRIVQEALANIARHAQARSASLLIERRQNEVVAVVEDDGQGFEAAQMQGHGRLGLLGVQERAELLGGRMTIESTPGQGTSLFVQIPIADQPGESNERKDPHLAG